MSDGKVRQMFLTAQDGAAYAGAILHVPLSEDEAVWFAAEMQRGADAVSRAAAGAVLFDVRMGEFDQLLQGRTSEV